MGTSTSDPVRHQFSRARALVTPRETTFRAQRNPFYLASPGGLETDLSDVLACDISRSVSTPGGSFSMVVKTNDARYEELIQSDDELRIDLDNGDGWRTEMWAFVDRVAVTRAVTGNGATVEAVQINGRESVGKVLQTAEIWFDQAAKVELAQTVVGRRVFEQQGLRLTNFKPDEIVNALIDGFAGADNQFVDQNGTPFINSDRLDRTFYVHINDNNRRGAFTPDALTMSGKLWPRIQMWADRAFNTLFFDVLPVPVKAEEPEIPYELRRLIARDVSASLEPVKIEKTLKTAMVFEPHPYTVKRLDELEQHDVYFHEVGSLNLGRSDADIFNVVKVQSSNFPQANGVGASFLVKPSILPSSVNIHGIRRLALDTAFPFQRGLGDLKGTLTQLSKTAMIWHIMNDRLFNGSIAIGRLRNDIRVGHTVHLRNPDEPGVVLLVEAINHNFVYQGTSTTSVSCTRGTPAKGDRRRDEFLTVLNQRIASLVNTKAGLIDGEYLE